MLVTDGPATILVRQSVTLTLQPWTIENGLFPGQEPFLAVSCPSTSATSSTTAFLSTTRSTLAIGPAVSNSLLGGGEIHYYLWGGELGVDVWRGGKRVCLRSGSVRMGECTNGGGASGRPMSGVGGASSRPGGGVGGASSRPRGDGRESDGRERERRVHRRGGKGRWDIVLRHSGV